MTNKIMLKSLKELGYYYDHTTNTLTMTKAFERKSSQYGTKECKTLITLENMFAGMQTEVYQVKRKNSAVTYEMMEMFLTIMPNSEHNLKEYARVKKMSPSFKSAYKYVADWFYKTFPYYGELIVKDENDNVVWDAVKLYQQARGGANTCITPVEAPQVNEVKPAA